MSAPGFGWTPTLRSPTSTRGVPKIRTDVPQEPRSRRWSWPTARWGRSRNGTRSTPTTRSGQYPYPPLVVADELGGLGGLEGVDEVAMAIWPDGSSADHEPPKVWSPWPWASPGPESWEKV